VVAQGQASGGNSQRDVFGRGAAVQSVIATARGVQLEWRTAFEQDNLGFDIYRVRNGERVRLNRTIIPGSVFLVGQGVLRAGHSYQYLDRDGTVDSVYYLESQSSNGNRRAYDSAISVSSGKPAPGRLTIERLSDGSSNGLSENQPGLSEFPASLPRPQTAEGQAETQWSVAAQSALKIRVNHDGWYRVTQEQASAAGFNPSVNINNVSLYGDGQEIAIRTSKASGLFSSGDYFEFFGRGLDIPSADSRIYYLIAAAQAGKRVSSASPLGNTFDVESDSTQANNAFPDNAQPDFPSSLNPTYRGWFAPLVKLVSGDDTNAERKPPSIAGAIHPERTQGKLNAESARPADYSVDGSLNPPTLQAQPDEQPIAKGSELGLRPIIVSSSTSSKEFPATVPAPVKTKLPTRARRKSRHRARTLKRHYSHASDQTQSAGQPLSYNHSVQLKERLVYFIDLLNGAAENYFGQVVGSTPVLQTLPARNIVASSANLVVALQGVFGSVPLHQVSVFVNDSLAGSISFYGMDHAVQTFTIPTWRLRDGNNIVKLTQGSPGDISIVDSITLTYPHGYVVDSPLPRFHTDATGIKNSLRFSLDASQSTTLSGFTKPRILLLDVTDPSNTKLTHPSAVAASSGYSVTVPVDGSATGPRSFYAQLEWQFETPAEFSLNQPSTLNQATSQQSGNHADLLIISCKDLIPSLAPLVAKRQGEGLTVKVIDVEDIYDEFSYGAHSAQAIKDFLARATTDATAKWTPQPRYVLLVGDASYDPRNYEGKGYWDLVPTKLIDTSYEETCSDDALADFNDDGISDLAIGRLPARTVAEANLMISKIVSFVPFSQGTGSQTAMLVADAQGDYYFNFAQASAEVGTLLPAAVNKQFVNRPENPTPSSDAAVRATIVNSFNQGRAIVNYTGHGNLDVWTGAAIFTAADARGLTNGSKLPFVVVADCLNGLFDDPGIEGLGESFLKAPLGGAVGVFASSGRTVPDGQLEMSKALYPLLFGSPSMTLGDGAKQAKVATSDIDVRRTWILLGDPSMKIW
jgi:hypothetical protein